MVETLTTSTDDVEPRHRLDFWSEMVAGTFAPFEITKAPSVEFHGRCAASQVDSLLLAQTDFAPSAASRRKDMIRSAHFDGFMFVIPNKGRVAYVDDNVSSIANPGDIAFYDYAQSFEFDMSRDDVSDRGEAAPDGIESINITVPREALTRAMGPASKGQD